MYYLSRVVIDAAKPVREYDIIELASDLANHVKNGNVSIKVEEVDIQTEGLKVTIEGKIDFPGIKKALAGRGAIIRSLDEASVSSSNGKK